MQELHEDRAVSVAGSSRIYGFTRWQWRDFTAGQQKMRGEFLFCDGLIAVAIYEVEERVRGCVDFGLLLLAKSFHAEGKPLDRRPPLIEIVAEFHRVLTRAHVEGRDTLRQGHAKAVRSGGPSSDAAACKEE